MFKKKQFKSLICTFLTFLMVFTSVNIGTLGMKQVFAETIKEESEVGETVDKLSIKTTLKDMTTKADKVTFDLWAKDANGNKIKGSHVKVRNNEKPVSVAWDDLEKTSYTLNLEVGTNNVEINIIYNKKNYTQKYTLIREQAEDGEKIGTFTFSMEAFTIGLGYLIEPVQINIHKGRNAAQELDAILKEYGYKYCKTGTLESSFYLATLLNATNKVYKTIPKIPEVLKKKLDENCGGNYDEKRYDSERGLGEFDFNNLSGWMYAVNNVFPNVGFADKYLQDGDVMRVQFTLALGNDIGGSDAMGGGSGVEFFPKVNKDELTKKIAQINSSAKKDEYLSNSKIKRAYDNGIEILQKFGISQQEIDKVSKNLVREVEEVDNKNPGKDKVQRIKGKDRFETSVKVGNKFRLENGEEKLKNVIISSAFGFADSLSGSILSKKLAAPIILTGNNESSSKQAVEYIKNNVEKNGNVYILGGTASVNNTVENTIKNNGYNIKRLSGQDRYATCNSIVKEFGVKEGTPIVIVNGLNFADALSVSAPASIKGYPVLLSGNKALPEYAKSIIKTAKSSEVYIIGGEGVLNKNIENEIKKIQSSAKITRINGKDRYETSLRVNEHFANRETVIMASGTNYPDALSGSALAGKLNASLLLVNDGSLNNQIEFIDKEKTDGVILLGGEGVLSKKVQNAIENIFK
ncbi:cell wall-binding repeat-containing protein [Clostridium sporogenes]|uniref:cell wall-binding repeat-containing protein n=1 Tax=Clostridium sporogenes TaxID=1509 RepID=UPI00313AE52F